MFHYSNQNSAWHSDWLSTSRQVLQDDRRAASAHSIQWIKTTGEVALLIMNRQNHGARGVSSAHMGSHGNGYADVEVRNAINEGRFDGPRYQVATRGIGWSASPLSSAPPVDPLARAPIHTVEEGRAEVREQIKRGADWIKLFPTGNYSFTATGKDSAVIPVASFCRPDRWGLPSLAKKPRAILGGGQRKCDRCRPAALPSARFGAGETSTRWPRKGMLRSTLVRYTEPYMDDVDGKEYGRVM